MGLAASALRAWPPTANTAGRDGAPCVSAIGCGRQGARHPNSGIQSICRPQNLHHEDAHYGSGQANCNALATECGKLGNRLSVPVKNEYWCVEYSTKRIKSFWIARLIKTKTCKRRLYARSGIAQQLQILQPAGRTVNV